MVVLVAEGSEESKLRNSNSRSKSITKALQDRKDKFDLFNGDDPMVPPGPKPRMVMKEMVIVEYHLSQVQGLVRGGGGGGERSTRRVPRSSVLITNKGHAPLSASCRVCLVQRNMLNSSVPCILQTAKARREINGVEL